MSTWPPPPKIDPAVHVVAGSEFDRAPREYRSPPASDLQRNLGTRKTWTRVEPSGPRYPELPPFLWGVCSGLALATPIAGLVGVLT